MSTPSLPPLEGGSTAVPRATRRRFLAWTGATAGLAAAGVGGAVTWEHLQRRAVETPLSTTDSVLVLVTLYGGNDGLGTVIPAGDVAYQQARPQLAYKPEETLGLGDGLGLNPGMTGMKGLWDDHRLAIVRGVGYPQPDHSHFRSMAIWQTADPRRPQPSGWIGRWLDTTNDPLRAISLESTLPPVLVGERLAGVTCPPRGLKLGGGGLGDALMLLGQSDGGDTPLMAEAAKSYAALQRAMTQLNPAVDRHREDETAWPPAHDPGAATRTGGAEGLRGQLALAATMIEMGLPTRVYSVSLGGFDTHAGERDAQERLLGQLDQALVDFQRRLDASGRGSRVVTVVHSEFGRRVQANASQGTDHGTAGPMFVMGDAVRPGFHGDQPSLTDLDDGDLKVTVDFRSVYANLLHRVLGSDPAQHLGGWDKELPVVA
ncbi:DUF1501 domain-containing protein [Mariniluteicoccus flavus]